MSILLCFLALSGMRLATKICDFIFAQTLSIIWLRFYSVISYYYSMDIELNQELREQLIQAAREVSGSAYCPYSEYYVGAALLGVDGKIHTGCNVENASLGLSICAERVAVFKAVSSGCRKFSALALAGGTDEMATPCGACRQVLSEFCSEEMPVFFSDLTDGEIKEATVGELLPLVFTKK